MSIIRLSAVLMTSSLALAISTPSMGDDGRIGPPRFEKPIKCTTDNGTELKIMPAQNVIFLTPKGGARKDIKIVSTALNRLKSNPVTLETTYTLDTGSALVTEFGGPRKLARGHWLKADGTSSANFPCQN